MLKAKDIEHEVKKRGFDRGVVYCIQTLAEQHRAQQMQLRELANYFNQMVDLIQNLVPAVEQAKALVDRFTTDDTENPNTIDVVRGGESEH